jgi:O-methyltransferase involved in polyketide biosynthesis
MKSVNKIHLTEEKETLLITLYAKALDNRLKKSILKDKTAEEIINSIDYDFKKFETFGNNNLIVIRARQYDEWLQDFLGKNTNALVLNLGCGLDTRFTRINPRSTVSWFDVDYPEVIRLRKIFYSDKEGYTMIESSVTEMGWLAQIPQNRPTIIIAEGLLEYLTPIEVKTLLNRLLSHFLHGQIIFDVMSSFAIKSGEAKLKETTRAVHQWAVDDITEVDQLDSKLKRMEALSIFNSSYMKQFPFRYRLLYAVMSTVPIFKNMLRLMRYQF